MLGPRTMKRSVVWLIAPSLVVFGFCVHPSFGAGDAPDSGLTPDEKRLKEAMLQYSDAVTALLEAEIEDNRQRSARGRISAQVYSQQVKWLQDKLNLYRKQPYQVPQLYLWKLKVGDIGRLTGNISSTTDPGVTSLTTSLFTIPSTDFGSSVCSQMATFQPLSTNLPI